MSYETGHKGLVYDLKRKSHYNQLIPWNSYHHGSIWNKDKHSFFTKFWEVKRFLKYVLSGATCRTISTYLPFIDQISKYHVTFS